MCLQLPEFKRNVCEMDLEWKSWKATRQSDDRDGAAQNEKCRVNTKM